MGCRHRIDLLVVANAFLLGYSAIAGATENVSVGLDFTISGYHAPFFVAQDKGYFSRAGLSVTITRGYGSGDTVKKLASGVIDVGFNHPAPLIIANAEGGKLRIVMSYLNQEMCATYSAAEDGNVRKPKDIEGQTWGGPPGDVCTIMLTALAEKTSFDLTKLKMQQMDAPQRLPMLAAGKITVTASFFDKDILFRKALQQAGKTMVSFRYAPYIAMYGNAVAVTQRTMETRPAMVDKLVGALMKGFKDTLANPDEAARIVTKLYPETDKEYIRAAVDTLLEAMWDETTRSKGIGMIDGKKMQETRDIVVKYWKLKTEPPVESIYTNRFVETAHKSGS
jgi:NitT/TauT family transport system substrate-binding protein